MLGTFALSSGYYDAYYGQAQRVRTLIIRDFDAAYESFDVLLSATTPTTAFEIGCRRRNPRHVAVGRKNIGGVVRLLRRNAFAGDDFSVRTRSSRPRSVGAVGRHIESRGRTTGERKRQEHEGNRDNRPAHTLPSLPFSLLS